MHIYYYEFFKNNSFHISPLLRKYEICNSDINTLFFIPYHFIFNIFQKSSQLTYNIPVYFTYWKVAIFGTQFCQIFTDFQVFKHIIDKWFLGSSPLT